MCDKMWKEGRKKLAIELHTRGRHRRQKRLPQIVRTSFSRVFFPRNAMHTLTTIKERIKNISTKIGILCVCSRIYSVVCVATEIPFHSFDEVIPKEQNVQHFPIQSLGLI